MKVKLKLDDQETRAVWETAQRAKADVASWPAWKRGEDPTTIAKADVSTQDVGSAKKQG
jgi:hypothetical protein